MPQHRISEAHEGKTDGLELFYIRKQQLVIEREKRQTAKPEPTQHGDVCYTFKIQLVINQDSLRHMWLEGCLTHVHMVAMIYNCCGVQ